MHKLLISLFALVLFHTPGHAQKNDPYLVVVSFNSMCCGVPNDSPLMKCISSFKKQNRIKHMAADRIGPMGKEGEYDLAFRLKELNRAQKIKFIGQLKKIVPTMKDKGFAEVKENLIIDKADLMRGATIDTQIL